MGEKGDFGGGKGLLLLMARGSEERESMFG